MQYEKRQAGANAVTKVFFAVFIPPISFIFYGFSFESLVTQLIGISLSLIASLFTMFSAFVFVVRNHRSSIQMIINKLEEFENADLSEFKDKENNDERICSEKSLCEQSNVVEEIQQQPINGEADSLRCDT